MISIILMVALTQAPDAPVVDMTTRAGDVVPFEGYCVETKEFIKREKVNVRNEVVAESAQRNLLVSPPVFVAIVLGALATGAAITLGAIEVKRVIDKKE